MATDTEDPVTDGEYLQEVAFIDTDPETTCSICHAEFLDFEDLDIHMQQVHKTSSEPDTSGSKICQFCDTTYKYLDVYARHIVENHFMQLISCESCTKCFTEEIKARQHERKHKVPKSSLFSCSQCKAIFSTQKDLGAHEFVHHNNTHDGVFLSCLPNLSLLLKLDALAFLQSKDRVLECVSCRFSPDTMKSYLEHLNTQKCIAYVCDICCYVSHLKKLLTKHFQHKIICRYPHELESEMTTCTTCKMRINCREMSIHRKVCSIYKCYVCNVHFKTIESLSEHQSTTHPVELDVIKCKFCSKEYVGQVALHKHVKRSHSHQFILYKYACRTCEQIFKHPQTLFAHYFVKHKELEPYTCKICMKKFKIRKRFTIHIKLEHKGVGAVEFDENYHVFFAEKKSEKPFIPKCVIPELVPVEDGNKSKTKRNSLSKYGNMTTDMDETDADNVKEQPKNKPKSKVLKRKRREIIALSSSEEEEAESLLTIKKRAERKHFQKRFGFGSKKLNKQMVQRKQLTCKVCYKYCYTFQNYQNHIKLHKKNESMKCIKCSEEFKTKVELKKHVTNAHSTSKLIETLKNVLERKQVEMQSNDNNVNENVDFNVLTSSERFMRTIKRVKLDKQAVSAIIAPTSGDISAKNFIENFVPDVGEAVPTKTENITQEPLVSVKQYESPFYRKNSIKMIKFLPEPQSPSAVQLKMPEKFKTQPYFDMPVKLNVKLVQQPQITSTSIACETSNFDITNSHDYVNNTDDCDDRDDADDIPEVAQEVMLEGSEEPPKSKLQAPRKIVIPKLPAGYPKIHIATLQTEAPYYKIITVKNSDNADEAIVIDTQKHKSKKELEEHEAVNVKSDVISLPDGTKFVMANPLAHLLGDKPVEEILEPIKNKHYKPAIKNIKGLLADALQNLDNGEHRVRKPKNKSKLQKPEKKKPEPRKNVLRRSEPGKSLPLL